MGTYPKGILTYIEAKWRVPNEPEVGGAFYSPWFGIEASDNLNLIQPVNPWIGDHWEMYNEYFQWVPENNINSDSHDVQPGDVLFGSVTYNPKTHSYTMFHKDLTDGWSVSTTIPIQRDPDTGFHKNFTIAYFVMEKEWDCNQYPVDGIVTFYDIKVYYDNKQVKPTWTTGIVDDVCNCRAKILNSTALQITWDTSSNDLHKIVH
jgi:hypothetical protein